MTDTIRVTEDTTAAELVEHWLTCARGPASQARTRRCDALVDEWLERRGE